MCTLRRPSPACLTFALVVALAPAARGQDPTYQVDKEYKLQLKADALVRKEWTRNLFADPDTDRWRFQIRPRLEVSVDWFRLGVGGDFDYSSDQNLEDLPAGQPLRDNYDSRDARLDLAFAGLETRYLGVQGGRFRMPVGLTEMLWDRDLRPQGGAVTLRTGGSGGRLSATALGARGSHPLDDDDAELLLFSATADLPSGRQTRLELTGSYLKFRKLEGIEPRLRRQNNRNATGGLAHDYHVWDGVARLRHEGPVPLQLVADYSHNGAVDAQGRGLWLAAVLGAIKGSRSRLEYTYASVDRDATVAAYAGDDFFWQTGWEGHRGDLGVRAGERSSLHVIGQLIRFKDAARTDEQEHWIRRYRVELRVDY
ncbi:MAG TPA: putative porin [Vicinamibacteria bacterium]